jgi:hypothetical protein
MRPYNVFARALRVCESARLLEYLFQHEVAVRPLLGRIRAPLRLVHLTIYGCAVRAEDIHFVARDFRDVALLQVDKALRHRQQCRCAAGNEVLTDAETDDQRARDPADDDALRVLRVNDQQREGARETGDRLLHCLYEVAALLQVVVNEVRGHLGVGLRYELVALRLQLVLDLPEVLDDPVVYDRNATAGHVRVRIGLGNTTVCRPAGMGHAQQAAQRVRPEFVLEFSDLADRLAEPDRLIAAEDGDAGRVVSTIFEAPETFYQYRDDVSFGNCTDDSAHMVLLQVLLRQLFFVGRFQPLTVICLLRSSVS